MNRVSRLCLVVVLAFAQLAIGLGGNGPAPASAAAGSSAADPLVRRLQAAGLRVISDAGLGTHRYFVLGIRQPVDHWHPRKGYFEQRISLLHRSEQSPTVLYSSGYGLSTVPSRSEPARLVDGNQVSVEHRFFTPSRPQPADWRRLTIWQAATDAHRIVAALKPIYPGRWLSTGASKGGMTSVYHRRFYPRDVDATVAYVAPNDAIDGVDSHTRFIDRVGTDPTCRQRLTAVQHAALTHRGALVARMRTWAAAKGYTYTRLFGSPDRALEILVLDTAFAFWQYQLQKDCATVPGPGASLDELWAFLDRVSGFAFYTDQGTEPYVPYYYQAGTQLGSPEPVERHLRRLLRYPGENVPRSFVPAEIPMRFQPWAMADVDLWVRLAGSRLMFVYGQNDPWSAEPFRLGPGTRDSFWYTVPGGNHGSKIEQLPAAQKAQATAAVRRWAGLPATAPGARSAGIPGLDGVQPEPRRGALP